MKQIFRTFAVAFAFVAAASCAKEVANPAENQDAVKLVPATIEASIDATKATAASDGKVTWQENDAIAVWVDGTKYEMTLTAGAGTKQATFKGELPDGGMISAAVSPASAATATPGVPAPVFKQTIAAGATCDPAALIMSAGAPADNALVFKNACGAGRFTLPGAGFSSISVYCDEGEVEVTLPATEGTFDVFLPAATYTNILIAATTLTGVTYGVQLPKDLTIKRSVITNLGTLAGEICAVITSAGELQAYLSAPATNAFIVKDINLADVDLTPCESLEYTLDGMGHSLKNWNTSSPMIITLAEGATVQNITIADNCTLTVPNKSNISDTEGYYAFLVGSNCGNIISCVNNADVTFEPGAGFACNMKVAGIAGGTGASAKGTHAIKDCINNGKITVTTVNMGKTLYCGGVAGQESYATAIGCVNNGNVTVTVNNDGESKSWSNVYLGGVLGTGNNGGEIIEDCINNGDVTLYIDKPQTGAYPNVGGVTSYTATVMKNCVNTGNVSMLTGAHVSITRPAVGGVAGYISKEATGCVNEGIVVLKGDKFGATSSVTAGGTGGTGHPCVGGVFGNAGHSKEKNDAGTSVGSELVVAVTDCINKGTVEYDSPNSATWVSVGGIVGYYNGTMTGCSSTAEALVKVIMGGAQTYSGGLVGSVNIGSKSSFINCVNNGKVWYVADNSNELGKATTRSYVAGILGAYQAGSKYVMTDCTNNGEVRSDNASTMIVGGLAGAWNGHMTGCKSLGDIVVNNATDIDGYRSEIGGISGYANTATYNWEDNAIDCNITVTGGKSVDVGGVFGAQGGAAVIAGTSVKVHIEAEGANQGAVLGSTRAAAVAVTLGTEEKPLVIKNGTFLQNVWFDQTMLANLDKLVGRQVDGASFEYSNVQFE